jgi:hypothetical protein
MEEGRRLERQKEPENKSASTMAPSCWEVKQKEQRPLTDEEKEYIRTIKSIISDFIRDKKPENLAYYQRIYDWLDGRHVPFSCGHENGKSTEWAELQSEFKNINEAFEDGKKEVIDHPDKYGLTKQKTPDPVFSKQEYESYPIISEDTTSAKPAELDGKALLYTADKSYQIGFRDGVASVKSAEWSEEDEDMLNSCISSIEEAKENRYAYKETDGDTSYDHEIAWLKSLRPVKQEWSVGDEDRIRQIERIAQQAGCTQKLQEEIHNWLKSLRPTHWKPSEEQMEALKNSAYGAYQNGDGPALRELYEQLKNL